MTLAGMSARVDGTILLPEVELGSKLIRDKPSFLSLPPLGWVVGEGQTLKVKALVSQGLSWMVLEKYVYGKKEPLIVT